MQIAERKLSGHAHHSGRVLLFFPVFIAVVSCLVSCEKPDPPYGKEALLILTTSHPQVWAVAPCVNLSGQKNVDALLQADLLYQQLQEVKGITVIPVNRTAEVYISLHLDRIQSEDQASLVCDLLGCDGLIVPTITFYDPYDPPKVGAVLQLFTKPTNYSRPQNVDPSELARMARPANIAVPVTKPNFLQVVGMFDAADGTTRAELLSYAAGRYDPKGAYKAKEYFVNMDRYSGFVYRKLIEALMDREFKKQLPAPQGSPASQDSPQVSSAPGKGG